MMAIMSIFLDRDHRATEFECLALSQITGLVVSGDRMGTIIVHSTKTGIVEYRADNVFDGSVRGLCYLPNGSLVACGNSDEGDEGDGLRYLALPSSWSRPWMDTMVMLNASPSLHQAPTLLLVEVMGS